MTGVDADLATLRDALEEANADPDGEWYVALARVEAELSRLREQRDDLAQQVELRDLNALDGSEVARVLDRAEAAEARCARLQQGIEELADEVAATWVEERLRSLAGPDTP